MSLTFLSNGSFNQYWLAWRFFSGSTNSSLVKFISRISIAGLSLAIALLVLVLSVMNGFEKEFRDRILQLAPHATLWFDAPTEPSHLLLKRLNNDPAIKVAQYFVEFKGLAIANNTMQPLLVKGLSDDTADRILKKFLEFDTESISASKTPHRDSVQEQQKGILIGSSLAKKLSLSVGDSIRLMLLSNSSGPQLQLLDGVKSQSFRVMNIFKTNTEIDHHLGVMNIHDAATLLNYPGLIQGIDLQLHDLFNARAIAYQTAVNFELPVRVSDWTHSFGNLYAAIKLSRELVVLLIASIIAVACFNVFVTLGMVVKQKSKAIAILRTIGMKRHQIAGIFVLQGLMITAFACLLGSVSGVLLAFNIPAIVPYIESLLQLELLNTDIYPINYLPVDIKATDVLFVCLMASAMSLVATIFPALRASRIMPAKALRYF